MVAAFHAGFWGTTLGPVAETVDELGGLLQKARNQALGGDEKARMADLWQIVIQNTPFINLFYTRPVLDFLILSSLREAASPGYLRRQERRRLRDYGQTTTDVFPAPLMPVQALFGK